MLELKGITKSYPLPRKLRDPGNPRHHGKRFYAVENVNLKVQPGEVHGIVGGNGSGKSTILRIAAGLSSQSSGVIYVDGKPKRQRQKTGVGYLPSKGSLYPFMSASDNVRFFGKLAGFRGDDLVRETDLAMLAMGCDRFKDVMPEELSFGQSQRVRLARLLITKPKALLLDEPSSGVDVLGTLQFQETLLHLAQSKVPIILVSHNATEVEALCDNLTFLNEGKVFYQGLVTDFVRANNSSTVGQAILNASRELDDNRAN
jgi:ABC-type multidrug transport system ATPase subunit